MPTPVRLAPIWYSPRVAMGCHWAVSICFSVASMPTCFSSLITKDAMST